MTNEELNQALYLKMCEEFNQFEENLLQEDPHEMLQSAYGYLIRQDIIYAMEEMKLSDKQCKALLSEEHPLEKIFGRWSEHESSYMDEIRDMIECTANEKMREDFIKTSRDSR